MSVLVLNCGSSSIKFSMVDPGSGAGRLAGIVDRIGAGGAELSMSAGGEDEVASLGDVDYAGALAAVTARLRGRMAGIGAVGHRFVHGGEKFTRSTLLDAEVLEVLRSCAGLAPLHNPANLMGIEATLSEFPDLPQAVVFDTAFHQTMPQKASLYAVPLDWYRKYGVRRYGFHGTSHRYVSREAARRLGRDPDDCALVTAHLGNGCSTCAVKNGRSIDTSMGMTPLEGLVMGTRSGNVDPGLHEHLASAAGMDVREVTRALNHDSGLLGVSGVGPDMRSVLQAAVNGDEKAELAVDMFCYRLAKDIGSMTVALGRLDGLAFTGGIGENSPQVRARVVGLLAPLGLELDGNANSSHGEGRDGVITREGSVPALVVVTNEALLIARDTWELVSGGSM